MPENDLKTLQEFFEKDGPQLARGEFIAFWKSLTAEEKAYYKSAELD